MMVTEKNLPTDPRYKAGFLGEIQESFIRLVEVDTGGTFDQAGLRVGDLITAFDDRLPLEWLRHLASGETPSLDRAKLSVLRDAARFETTVLLREPTATDSENL